MANTQLFPAVVGKCCLVVPLLASLPLFTKAEDVKRFSQNSVYRDHLGLDFVILETKAPSTLSCARECSSRSTCASFTYAPDISGSGSCRAHSVSTSSLQFSLTIGAIAYDAVIDLCAEDPCQNGGTCTMDQDGHNFICSCPGGYTGETCQLHDPCTSNVMQNLFNPSRSIHMLNGMGVCDSGITPSWYRLTLNGVVGFIPTTCRPARYYCGSYYPMWMEIPSQGMPAEGQQVDTRACGGGDTASCCESPVNITVRNCSTFLLYYLRPTTNCNFNYCVDTAS